MSAEPVPPADVPDPSADADALNAQSIAFMRRVRDGDERAFRDLVELHQHAVIGTCARMLGDVEEAHDLAQTVFLRVWKAAPRYEPSARFTTWLYTIVRNLVFNESRRRSRRPLVSLDAPLPGGDDENSPARDVPDPQARPADAAAAQAELEAAIDRAIAALPEQQRLAVTLRKYEDMPYEEIAAVLKTSVPSVKSLLFRARTHLRESLRAYLE